MSEERATNLQSVIQKPTMSWMLSQHSAFFLMPGGRYRCKCGELLSKYAPDPNSHQSEKLAAAGFGSRRDAAMEALSQAAEELESVNNELAGTFSPAQERHDRNYVAYLRDRATKIGETP